MKSRKTTSAKKGTPTEPPARHPLRGAMKGMIHISPGVDLTEPAFPDFEKDWLEANAWWLDDPKLNPKR